MEKYFSDEQIISILREAEAGFKPVNSAVSTSSTTLPSTQDVKSLAVWKCRKLSV
ncbi:hypothetical protein M2387_004880 [Klebsiella sp. BIGb0407]|nr:hypothetical protein [Klebsiella sp. BIGb0407]